MNEIIEQVSAHANETQPNECCGLVIERNGAREYVRCTNVAGDPTNQFVIDPEEYARVEDMGEIVMIAHSHCYTPPIPSEADKVGIEETNLPWLIVNYPVGNHTITTPSGYRPPLLERRFVKGVLDCYALVKDYYDEKLNIALPHYPRPTVWHEVGNSYLLDNFRACGLFEEVPLEDLQPNDCVLMQIASTVPNHVAVYVGDDKILHHLENRLSGHDVYGGFWRKVSTHAFRYVGEKQ